VQTSISTCDDLARPIPATAGVWAGRRSHPYAAQGEGEPIMINCWKSPTIPQDQLE
jgi:hypothetical protein